MDIRKKITYQFLGSVALLLWVSLMAIYFSFSQARKEEFYDRLGRKAKLVAEMLIDIEEIDSELLLKIEKNNPLNLANEKIVIYDFQNQVIYSTDEDNFLDLPGTTIEEVRIEQEIRFRKGNYEIFGQFYTGQYERIVVFAAATDIFGKNKLKWLRIIMILVFTLSLIFVWFAGRLFAVKALAPISTIVNQANKIEAKNLSDRLDTGNGKDEIARLAKTFNSMLERLELAFRIQKNFIANASHELRTPLTVITGQLEVVLMKARNNEEYKNTLLTVLDEIKDLNNLSNKLLLLAQTNLSKGELDFINIRIDEIIWKCRKDVLGRDPNNIIDIYFGEEIDDENKMLISGNEQLLKTAIVNLMDNACKYSDNHRAEVHLNALNEKLILKFIDQGIGIAENDLKMIFEPFYRSKNVLHSPGHGIGLSLVKKIVSLHNGKIHVKSELQKGTEFKIILPAKI
jgi:signal transduction histidine kinase